MSKLNVHIDLNTQRVEGVELSNDSDETIENFFVLIGEADRKDRYPDPLVRHYF